MSPSTHETDPRPVPPARPESNECCQGGCARCIFDWYDEAMERYHADLRAWTARHQVHPGDDPSTELQGHSKMQDAQDIDARERN